MSISENNYKISVLVATKNRNRHIVQFIENLSILPAEPKWELIVVDNGSTDGTSDALKQIRTVFPLKIYNEPLPGKSRALNLAILKAKGDLLVFTDDDIIPEQPWLQTLYDAACNHPEVNIFGGCIKVDEQLLPKWIRQSFNLAGILASEHYLGEKTIVYPFRRYPIGPNMAVRKSAIAHIKEPWPLWLGPGTDLPLADERSFLEHISPVEGTDRLYVAKSIVWHIPEEDQLRFLHALKRCYQSGLTQGKLDRINKSKPQESYKKTGSLVFARLNTCRSIRELLCILIRGTGVIVGRYTKNMSLLSSEEAT